MKGVQILFFVFLVVQQGECKDSDTCLCFSEVYVFKSCKVKDKCLFIIVLRKQWLNAVGIYW